MTNTRKEQIKQAIYKIENIRADIKELQAEEQDEFDNIPLGAQMGETENNMLEVIDCLDAAIDSIRDVEDYLKDAILY